MSEKSFLTNKKFSTGADRVRLKEKIIKFFTVGGCIFEPNSFHYNFQLHIFINKNAWCTFQPKKTIIEFLVKKLTKNANSAI